MLASLIKRKDMRRFLFAFIICSALLAGCVRPATVTSWSPVGETPAATPESTLPALDATQSTEATAVISSATNTPFVMPEALPHSMKGYELYAWQQGADWYFTLFTGTNRSKAFEEIIAPENQIDPDGLIKITVAGVEQIQAVIALLPEDEVLTWGGMDLSGQVPSGTVYLTFPPQEIIDKIQETCKENQVSLQILKEP